ncbi:hypothetical protein MO973_00730 [Paenibacillus sp. TRM 82003]|nr:hypothetical protein [Paenibacillus sp. TRM 82003]
MTRALPSSETRHLRRPLRRIATQRRRHSAGERAFDFRNVPQVYALFEALPLTVVIARKFDYFPRNIAAVKR